MSKKTIFVIVFVAALVLMLTLGAILIMGNLSLDKEEYSLVIPSVSVSAGCPQEQVPLVQMDLNEAVSLIEEKASKINPSALSSFEDSMMFVGGIPATGSTPFCPNIWINFHVKYGRILCEVRTLTEEYNFNIPLIRECPFQF